MQSVDGDVRLSVGFDTKELQKNLSKVFANTMKSITTSSKELDKSFIVVGNSSDTVNKTIKEINRNILKLVDLVVDFRQNISKISGISPTLLNDFTSLTKSMTEIVSQSTKFGNAWSSKKIKVDSTVSTMMQLQLNAEKAKNTVDKLKAALDALNASKSVSTKYEALSTEYTNTTNSIDKLFIEIQKTEQQLQSLKTEFGDNSDTVKQYEDYLRGLELQYRRLTAQADNLHTSLNNMKVNNEVFVFNTDAEQAEFDNLQAQLENAQGQFDIAQKKVEEFQQALDSLAATNVTEQVTEITDTLAQSEPTVEHWYDELVTLFTTDIPFERVVETARGGLAELRNIFAGYTTEIENDAGELEEIHINGLFDNIKEKFTQASEFVNVIRQPVDKLANVFSALGAKIKGVTKNIIDFVKNSKLAKKGTTDLNNAIKKGIGIILKYGLGIRSTYILVNKLRSATKEGYKNLAGYSDTVNKSISSVLSSLAKFKNQLAATFEPIVTYVVPILNKLIAKLNEALVALSKFFGAWTGRQTVYKANDMQKEYVESLDETAKSAKKAEDALKSYLSPLDDINRFTDNNDDSSSKSKTNADDDNNKIDYSNMFTTIEVDSKFKEFVEKIKKYFSKIFEPIKKAWDKYGKPVIDSIKTAFNSVKGAISSVHSSFMNVWTGGTGETIVGNILQIFKNILDTISNISTNFKTAWDSGVGTDIIQTLADILNTVLEHINNISEKTSEWADGLDFEPILSAFDTVLTSIQGIVDSAGDFGEKVWDKVFLPLSEWALEEGAPAALEALSGFLDVVNAVGKVVADNLTSMWDNFFSKWIDFAGDIVVKWLQDIGQFFKDVSDNPVAITILGNLITSILGIAAAVLILNTALAINPFMLIAIAIGAVSIAIIEVVENWDTLKEAWLEGVTTIGNSIKDFFINTIIGGWKQFIDGTKKKAVELKLKIVTFLISLKDTIKTKVGEVWDNLKTGAKDAWAKIKNVFSNVGKFFGDTFSKAWQKVKDIFSKGGKIFSGIKEGIETAFKKIVNSLIDGINRVVSTPFNAINNALSGLRNTTILDFQPFNWLPSVDVPQIPHLAKGAVLPPRKEFMAVLGDQKNGRNLEAPENLIRQIVHEESNSKGNTYNLKAQIGRRTLFEIMIEEAKIRQAQTGDNPFELA